MTTPTRPAIHNLTFSGKASSLSLRSQDLPARIRNLLRNCFRLAAALGVLCLSANATAKEQPAVATIAPLHSLLQNIAKGEPEAQLLTPPSLSPHRVRLTPSRARLLHNAAVIFYVGESLETFLKPALESLPANIRRARVTDGMTLLHFQKDDEHDEHDHEEHSDHDDHDKHHDHEEHEESHDHDEHDHEEHSDRDDHDEHHDHEKHEESHDHDEHDHGEHSDHDEHDEHHDHEEHHDHGSVDLHVWLDIDRAKQIAQRMAAELSQIYPDHRERYNSNLQTLNRQLDELDEELQNILAPVRGRSFMSMHDAYQYFTRRYRLSDAGALLLGHDAGASAKRLREMRQLIAGQNIKCVFGEPQFPATRLAAVADGANIKTGLLDPLGSDLAPGQSLYFELMRNMARAFADCLAN